MALISCPECGKQVSDRAVSCPNCGCPISAAPAAPVQQNPAEDLNNLLALARRARTGNDGKNAKRYYDQILMKDPGNWEAMFYSVYFEAAECRIMDIAPAANSVANSIYGTFCAIKDLKTNAEITDALDDIITSALVMANILANAALSHYNKFTTHQPADDAYWECQPRMTAVIKIFCEIESALKNVFPHKEKQLKDFQKTFLRFVQINKRWDSNLNCSRLETLANINTSPVTHVSTSYSDSSTSHRKSSTSHRKSSTSSTNSSRAQFKEDIDAVLALLDSELAAAIEIGQELFQKVKNNPEYKKLADYDSFIEQAQTRITAWTQRKQEIQREIEALELQIAERKKQISELRDVRAKLGLMKQRQKKEIDEQIVAHETATTDDNKEIAEKLKIVDANSNLRTAPADIKRIIRSQKPEIANKVCKPWDTFKRTHGGYIGVKADGTLIRVKARKGLGWNSYTPGWRDIVAVKTVGYTLVGLRADGTVVTATDSGKTELASELSNQRDIVAICGTSGSALGLKKDGTVVVSQEPGTWDSWTACAAWRDIVAISMRSEYRVGTSVVGLKSNGTVVYTGPTNYGQNDIIGWNNIVAVSTSGLHTIGLRSDGTVWAAGRNRNGECNVSDWSDIIAIDTYSHITVGLKADGTVVICGDVPWRWSSTLPSWSNIIAIHVSSNEIFGLKADGTIAYIGNDVWDESSIISGITDIKLPE